MKFFAASRFFLSRLSRFVYTFLVRLLRSTETTRGHAYGHAEA